MTNNVLFTLLLLTCATAQIALAQPHPAIVTQPQDQSAIVSSNATFSITASGQSPLAYQWLFNGTNLVGGGRFNGATNPSLTISNVTEGDAGNYQVIVSNKHGSVTSSNAVLTVLIPAHITTQPTNRSVVVNGDVTFTAAASGTGPLVYQWQQDGVSLTNGGRISGAESSTLTISGVQTGDVGTYQLVVTNAYGSALSSNAVLTVLIPAHITTQPTNQSVLVGGSVIFSAAASGSGLLNYQWQKDQTVITNNARISGATTNALTITSVEPGDAGTYRLFVTNAYGGTFSSDVTLTVLRPPNITQQPTSLTNDAGGAVALTVFAEGSDPLGYQWFFNGTTLTNSDRVSGADSPALSIFPAQTNDSGQYRVLVSNAWGMITSSPATVLVQANPRIVTNPTDQPVLLNATATFFAVTAGSNPLSHQWYFGDAPLSDDARITGATTPTLSIQNVQSNDVGGYRLVLSNLHGTATSSTAALTLATMRYVNVNNSSPAAPYTSWASAAKTIQEAVDVSGAGDVILVTNGVYSTGGRVLHGSLTNRVAVDRPISIRSVSGPQFTSIEGIIINTRCVYLTNGASLSGFTLRRGRARSTGDPFLEQSGGGAYCQSTSAVLRNCVITNSSAWNGMGGGVYSGTLYDCTISGNTCSPGSGGGAAYSVLNRCLINGNTATWGGGASQCSLNHCTLVSNTARHPSGSRSGEGGGAISSELTNCIVMNNTARVYGGGASFGTLVGCLVVGNSAIGGGGASAGRVVNCTVVGNSATFDGMSGSAIAGGLNGGTVLNSIIFNNNAMFGPNYYGGMMSNCCTVPLPTGAENFTDAPAFVSSDNYRLQTNSPCIGAGNNSFVQTSVDADGRPRFVGPAVDVGAYEFQEGIPGEFLGWLAQYGFSTSGSADYIDSDSDRLNNWQEWIAGTDPKNFLSVLKIISLSHDTSGTTLHWKSVAGKNYFLQRSPTLSDPFSTIYSNIVGLPGLTTFSDTNAVGPLFYRIGVE